MCHYASQATQKSHILQDPNAAGMIEMDFLFVDFSYLQGGQSTSPLQKKFDLLSYNILRKPPTLGLWY